MIHLLYTIGVCLQNVDIFDTLLADNIYKKEYMSKKKKNKFKRSKRPARPSSHNTSVIADTPIQAEPSNDSLSESDDQTAEIEKVIETPEEDNRYEYVKKDVRKLIISILGLIVLAAIIYFLNQKFLFLQSLGNWIYKIANFQI